MLHDLYVVLWGATWGNNIAWLESLLAIGFTTFFIRDRIGKRLAGWWHRHAAEHHIEHHLEALRRFEKEKGSSHDSLST